MAFPAAGTPTTTVFASSTSSMAVGMPTTVGAGDLLLAIVQTRNLVSTWTPPSGWSTLFTQAGGSTTGGMAVFYIKATGSEGGTTPTWGLSGATTAAWQVIGVTGWDGLTTPAFATSSGDFSTNPSSPILTPPGGTADYLWLALVGDAATGSAFTAAPSGYSGFLNTSAATGGSAAELASAYLQATASSETPGVWGFGSNRFWAAATIAVKPASGGGGITNTTNFFPFL